MIIRRYLFKETFKTQLAILLILFMIFFSQKLIRVLSSAVDGDIPTSLVMPILMLGVSSMASLILPLSLFLGILVTFGRFYHDSEMVAMYACGVKKRAIYFIVAILSILTLIMTIGNSAWFSPWSSIQEQRLIEDAKLNPSLAGLLAGQFQQLPQGNTVIYIGDADKNKVHNIFIAHMGNSKSVRPSITLANEGNIIHDNDGNQIIQLDKANRYEGHPQLRDYRVSYFENYQAIIKAKDVTLSDDLTNKKVEQLSLSELKSLNTAEANAEYYWRLSLMLSVPLMAFLVIPLSVSNPRQGKINQILPAIFLYLVYFLFESTIKANAAKGRLDPELWFVIVNGGYFLLALIFNLWDTLPIRRLRYKNIPISAVKKG